MKILVINDTSYESHVGCLLVKEAYKRLFSDDEITFKSITACREKEIPSDIGSYDLVLINGEGSFHNNGRSGEIILGYVREVKLEVPGIKIGIVNSIWYKNSGYIKLLELCDFFYSRDKESLSEVASYSLLTPKYCPDFVYYSLYMRGIERQIKQDGIVFQNGVSGLVKPCGDGEKLSIFVANNWIKKIKNWKQQITKSDIKSISRMLGKLGEHFNHKTFHNVDEFLNYVKSKDFVVSGRYHMVVISIYLEIPFHFSTSNTPKIEFHLNDIGLSPNSRVYRCSEIYRKDNIKSFTDDEKVSIREFKKKIPEFYEAMVNDIVGIVNDRL